jgi:hypothetical protein
MWIAKGTLLGIWLFSFLWLFGIVRMYLLVKKLSGGRGPGLFGTDLLLPHVSSPAFWLWLVACFALGFAIAYSVPVRPVIWISLAVTGLVPVGLMTLILVLALKLKQHVN